MGYTCTYISRFIYNIVDSVYCLVYADWVDLVIDTRSCYAVCCDLLALVFPILSVCLFTLFVNQFYLFVLR